MATVSSLSAPGVEVREYDNSLRITNNTGTTVFVPGYAAQGPVEEVITISSINDFENIYGIPTNDAERYFYYTCLAILNNSGPGTTLLTSRLAYGANDGDNVANAYTLLAYPVIPYKQKNSKKYDYYKPDESFNKAFGIIIDENTILKHDEKESSLEVVIASSIIDDAESFKITEIVGEYIPSFKCTNEDYHDIDINKPTIAWKYGSYLGAIETEIFSELSKDTTDDINIHISGKLIDAKYR